MGMAVTHHRGRASSHSAHRPECVSRRPDGLLGQALSPDRDHRASAAPRLAHPYPGPTATTRNGSTSTTACYSLPCGTRPLIRALPACADDGTPLIIRQAARELDRPPC